MAKRKTFYVPAAIFEGGHSAYAVAVYAYLCFCCDKSGVCFPGMETIAEKCGIARSTARNAIAELERSGLIRSEATHQTSRSGKIRRGTNRYRLTEAPVSNVKPTSCDGAPSTVSRCTPPPCDGVPLHRETAYPPPCDSGEIYNNSKEIMGDVPSVGHNACEDTTGLDAILAPLYLDSFFDQVFAQSVKQAIKTMYDLPILSVNGMRIPNALIRKRLMMLTIDHIDYVEKQIDAFSGEITNGERYLMACIYNAPVDCMMKNVRCL